jgi:hypothetical protein
MIVAGLPAAGGGVGLFGDGAVSAHESGRGIANPGEDR